MGDKDKLELLPGQKLSKNSGYLLKIYGLTQKRNGKQKYSYSELTKQLTNGKYRSHPSARDFLDSLKENNILTQEETRGNFPNQVKVYSLDQDKLVETFFESDFMQEYLDLIVESIKQEMKGYTVDRKIELPSFLGKKYEITLRK